ncbi:MAG: phage tail sheath family protein [Chitinophagaceae bacterium]|nr:phage tail sheath family protein [Chitinophagaceae bacterium]
MSESNQHPDQYINEQQPLPTAIVTGPTAIPVFIGYTEKRGSDNNPLPVASVNSIEVTRPQKIHSLEEYISFFGKTAHEPIDVFIEEITNPNTQRVDEISVKATCNVAPVRKLYYHMKLYFANGGGPCYIISTGNTSETTVEVSHLLAGIEMAATVDDATLLVCPHIEQLAETDAGLVYKPLLRQAGELKDRFAILDCFDNEDSFRIKDAVGNEHLNFGAVYHPYLRTSIPVYFNEDALRITRTVDGTQQEHEIAFESLEEFLQEEIISLAAKLTVTLPPSAAVAGAYVQSDAIRDVWTAPADIVLKEVTGPTIKLDEKDQAQHIGDMATGKSINVIRQVPQKGPVVIGARTLAGRDPRWKYISMRRTVSMIESAIRKSLQPFVYEPNNGSTWVNIQMLIENFLQMLWHRTVLQGARPDHAFFVKVGLGETMTEQDIADGKLIVETGMAMIIPAEFFILKFELKMHQPE